MSPNNAPQKQDAGSPNPSQEATPEPKVPSLQEGHKAAPEPQASPLEATGKASPSLLRRYWDKLRASLSIIYWEATNILEYLFGVLAEVRVPIVLGLLFLFLHQLIEQLAVKLLIAPVLALFNAGWLSSLVWIGLALALVAYAFLLGRRRYVVGRKWVLTALMVLLGYYYYRCTPQGLEAIAPFRFALLFDGARWAFADIIPFTCILLLLVWGYRYLCLGIKQLAQIRRCSWTSIRDSITSWVEKLKKRYAPFIQKQGRKLVQKVEGFLTDHPLTEEEEELSGWTSQAQTLTQKLLATDTSHAAFSLGIVASWGEGKSSFMGIMQRYLQQARQEVIVMHFNPWLYDKEAQLTKVFFEELRRTLAPYSSKLSKSIDNYADLLLAVDSSWLKLAHELLRLSQRSTTEQFDKLSRDIKELGRRVVIFIDDVDRLTREELMELFNLVRNSSNLPCLYFVLAYDKSYVLKTLQSEGEHMSRYPEKILQEEYPLPKLAPDKMWTVLERCLSETQLGKEYEDKKQGEKDDQAKDKENKVSTLLRELKKEGVNLPYHLTTIRMVKRIVNAFNSRYELLHKVGVAPFDLFIFELIYYVYPGVYDLLLEMHKEALTSLNANPGEYSPSSTNSSSSFFFSDTNPEGMSYISLNLEVKNASTIDSIVDALKKLAFGLEDGYKEEIMLMRVAVLLELLWGKYRPIALGQINHETYWRRYFYRGLQVGELSQEEFASFLTNPDRSKRKQCLERWSQEKPIAFMQEVLGYTRMNEDELGTIVYAMLDWNSLSSVDTPFNYREIGFLIRRAAPTDDWKKEEFPEILQDDNILSSAFDYTVGWLQAYFKEAAILPKESLHAIQEAIFKKIAEKENCINLYTRYWLRAGEHKGYGKLWTTPGLDECMREHIIKEGIEQFSKYTLSRTQEQDDFIYYLHDIPWENLTALAEDLRMDSKNQGDNNFLRFIKLALDEEQRLQTEMKRDVLTSRRVKIRLSREQWEPKEEPAFLLSISNASHEEYPFLFSKPDANES